MKMKKLIAAAMALVLSAPAVFSQGWPASRVQATLVRNFDVPAAGYTYVVFGSRNGDINFNPIPGVLGDGTAINKPIKTVGSSDQFSAVTANAPFQGMAVGDLLIFPQVVTSPAAVGVIEAERAIIVFTDANNVQVDAQLNLSRVGGYTFRHKKRYTTTSADQGYFDVSGFDNFTIQAEVNTLNATSLDFILECRNSPYGRGHSESTWTKNFTAVGSFQIHVTSRQDQCRVGWKFNTDTGVQSVATYFHGAK